MFSKETQCARRIANKINLKEIKLNTEEVFIDKFSFSCIEKIRDIPDEKLF